MDRAEHAMNRPAVGYRASASGARRWLPGQAVVLLFVAACAR